MANCDHNCSSCNSKCGKEDFIIHTNELSNIKKVIGIVSGKGGVGKSLVTSLLAVSSAKLNYKSAILDGDILGPSIPKVFGVKQKAYGDITGKYIVPAKTSKLDIDIISSTMLLENETDPVIWRGSMVSNILKQFYSDVVYDNQDVLFIDMPPGTGDVPLTIFQSVPLDGIIIVTSPQDLVSLIVTKAIKMANMMNIPILGIVENYSYIVCPDCNNKIELFGKSKINELASENNVKNVIKLPLDPSLTTLCDEGKIEDADVHYFDDLIKNVIFKK